MVRALSVFGMTGGFLIISPPLRATLGKQFGFVAERLNDYSPWSYIGLAVAIFAMLTLGLYRTSVQR
jgi:hypothetical protein